MNTTHKIPRVLFVGDKYPPFVGGSVTLMHNLFMGLDTSESLLVTQSTQGYSPAAASGIDRTASAGSIARIEVDGIPARARQGLEVGASRRPWSWHRSFGYDGPPWKPQRALILR